MNKAIFAVFSKVFLLTSPFALFCSKNGNGGYLFLVFLALGGICAWIGKGALDPTVRVKPKEWWETQFRMTVLKDSELKGGLEQLSSRDVQSSWDFANYITSSNGCPMPTEEEKERIVKSMGLVTEKMEQEIKSNEDNKWDRLQVGKHYLLKEFQSQFKTPNCTTIQDVYIKYSVQALKFSNKDTVNEYSTLRRFKKYIEEMWNTELSASEKEEARKWVEEYKNRFFKELKEFRDNKTPMHTIKLHYDKHGYGDEEFDKKYGFVK